MKKFKGRVKTVSPLGTKTRSVLPAIPKIKTQSLVNILISIKKEDDTDLVTYDQATDLSNIRFKTRQTPVLTLKDRPFVYEITNMLNKLDYDIVYNFLDTDWEKVFGPVINIRHKILFENPLLSQAKQKQQLDMEIYRSKVDVSIGAVDCKRCRSSETISVERQIRAADEPVSIKIFCTSCSYRWTAQ